MSIFKRVFLIEELKKEHKKLVDTWEKGNNSFSDHVFGGEDVVRVPLRKPNGELHKPHQHISDHLERHGYTIKDYPRGIVTDGYGRDVRIGRALTRSKAPAHYLNEYSSDPARLEVAISRHPYDVAGMSTGKNWASCMTIEGHYPRIWGKHLPADLKHGTHVAYLTYPEDKTFKSAVARIALKPFISEDGHKILRPEEAMYPKDYSNDSFYHTTRSWTEDNFRMKDPVYQIHPDVYPDSGTTYAYDKNRLREVLKNPNEEIAYAAAYHRDLTPEDISHVLGSNEHSDGIKQAVLRHSKTTREHVTQALQDGQSIYLQKQAMSHTNFDNDHIRDILDRPNTNHNIALKALASSSGRLGSDHLHEILNDPELDGIHQHVFHMANQHIIDASHIDKGLDSDVSHIREAALNSLHADTHHIMRGLKDNHPDIRNIAARHHELDQSHVDYIMDNEGRFDATHTARAIERTNNIEHLDRAMSNSNSYVQSAIINNKHAQLRHFDNAINHDDEDVKLSAFRKHPGITEDHITQLINSPVPYEYARKGAHIRMVSTAINHPLMNDWHINHILNNPNMPTSLKGQTFKVHRGKIKPHHIDSALDNHGGDYFYLQEAMSSPQVNTDHLTKFLHNDKFKNIHYLVYQNPNLTKDHLDHITSTHTDLLGVAHHPNLTSEHIHNIIKNGNFDTTRAIARHPNLTSEHIDKLMEHPDGLTRATAIQGSAVTPEHLTRAIAFSENERTTHAGYYALLNPKATKEHVYLGLKSENANTRNAALHSHAFASEHLHELLDNPDKYSSTVRMNAVKRHEHMTPELTDKAVKDSEHHVVVGALDEDNPHVTPKHIDAGLAHDHHIVRLTAIANPKVTNEQLERAVNDDHVGVRRYALEQLEKRKGSV